MGRAIRITALLLLAATSTLSAQPAHFGERFPLANTRYRATWGQVPRLVSTGSDLVLFWLDGWQVRSTKIVDGERRGGKVVLTDSTEPDAVWTGTHFVVVSWQQKNGMLTQVVDAGGNPVGEPWITGAPAPYLSLPRLAWNGTTLLLLYTDSSRRTRVAALDRWGRGTVSDADPIVADFSETHAIASNGKGFAVVIDDGEGVLVTMLDGSGRKIGSRRLDTQLNETGVAVASNGDSYLVVWSGFLGISGAEIAADGTIGETALLDQPAASRYFRDPAVAWNGQEWTLACTHPISLTLGYFGRFLRVGVGLTVLSRDEENNVETPSLALHGGTMRIAWQRRSSSTVVADWPSAGAIAPETVTFIAAGQGVQATATSADATLVVWNESSAESTSLRAGLRMRTGEWLESTIAQGLRPAMAASDGRRFVVIANNGGRAEALHLDESAGVIGATLLPFSPSDILWNGREYVLVGANNGIATVRLSPSGTLSEVVRFSANLIHDADPRIASNGSGYLVAWGGTTGCPIQCLHYDLVFAARLDVGLQRIGPEHEMTKFQGSFGPPVSGYDVAWNGADYTLAWAVAVPGGGTRVYAAQIPPSSGEPGQPVTLDTDVDLQGVSVTERPDGAAVLWQRWPRQGLSFETRLAFLDRNGALVSRFSIPRVSFASSPLLATLPDGRAAYVASEILADAPHHGTEHVVMAIADSIPLHPPDRPARLDARLSGRNVVLEWEPSPSAVNGYRVEYRVADGSWNEIEGFFGPEERTAYFTAQPGRMHGFRVRAFADGGTSAYAETQIYAGKRRSVR